MSISIREEARAILVAVDCDALGPNIASERLDSARDRIEVLGGGVAFESQAGSDRVVATIPLA